MILGIAITHSSDPFSSRPAAGAESSGDLSEARKYAGHARYRVVLFAYRPPAYSIGFKYKNLH